MCVSPERSVADNNYILNCYKLLWNKFIEERTKKEGFFNNNASTKNTILY